ncbi:MAG: guanylate kinase, partial [Cucumibacter sp.]
MELKRRGVMLVIASPSGAGKTSITRALMARNANLSLSISVTTRPKRTSEVDGVHYRFLSLAEFEAMRDRGQLLEWARVHDNFYGTPKSEVEDRIRDGRDVAFDIDWQGTLQLYEKCSADMVTVFVLPPSIAELKARLERRAQDSSEVIAR